MAHEFDGKKYAETSAHQKEWGTRLIDKLGLRGNEAILDLGCGDGFLTVLLAERAPEGRIVGIDASRGMIDAARRHWRDNLEFHLRDINDLDFSSEFDLIFSNATLHWVHDHRKLLRNCCGALKPRGRIRFNFAADGNCSNFNETVRALMKEQRFASYFEKFVWPWYMPPLTEYEELASASGLAAVKVWGENLDRNFPDVDALVGWIDQPSIVPFLHTIPDESTKKEFRDELVERMIAKTKQADGTCFETFRRINITGEKA